MTTMRHVVDAALAYVDSGVKVTDVLRDYMAGIPAAKRDERVREVYKAIRTIDGKLTATKELPERESKAYSALRQAYKRLFATKKRGKTRKVSKGVVTKVTGVAKAQVRIIAAKPKRLSDTLRVILATIQAQEKPGYKNVPALTAALQVCIDLAV